MDADEVSGGDAGNMTAGPYVVQCMKVDIFSDVVCPWCAIGKRRFEAALERFDHREAVDVHWRAFELDPSAPSRFEGDTASRLAAKYGMTREQALTAQERLTATAALDGLEFHLDTTKPVNTFDAHRLLHYARSVGGQDALTERLFVGYFAEGRDISDCTTLVRLGEEAGLDATKSAEILAKGEYATDVRTDEREARELGIGGVPFFVIDRRFGVSGAQSADVLLQVLEEAWTNRYPHNGGPGDGDSDATCQGDACVI